MKSGWPRIERRSQMIATFIISGLILLTLGGELLVRGAVNLARALGISPLLVGLVIVGFGTSTPELAISIFAAYKEAPGIVMGNVVGSNIANILLILGVSALIAPLAVRPSALRRDGIALVGSTLACLVAVLFGVINGAVGSILVLLLVLYVGWAYVKERNVSPAEIKTHVHMAEDAAPEEVQSPGRSLGVAVLGIFATIVGARLLVDGAIDLARGWGLSETVIGLTIVAVGTSLPELVACAIAAFRRHGDVALGNVIGSNVYNVFGVLGFTAVVHPISIPGEIVYLDIWVLILATGILITFLRSGWLLRRWEGAVLLVLYAAYLVYLAYHG